MSGFSFALTPCPFCGWTSSYNGKSYSFTSTMQNYYVEFAVCCDDCGAVGPDLSAKQGDLIRKIADLSYEDPNPLIFDFCDAEDVATTLFAIANWNKRK